MYKSTCIKDGLGSKYAVYPTIEELFYSTFLKKVPQCYTAYKTYFFDNNQVSPVST